MDTPDELTTFSNTAEAELAKEHLELEGITAFVVGSVTASVVPHLANGGSVALQVATDDAPQAREILGTSDA
jgi:H+/Cl- antiporter ClcA